MRKIKKGGRGMKGRYMVGEVGEEGVVRRGRGSV